MSTILVDSSVWIDYFNGNSAKSAILSDLLDNNAVCINDLILSELVPHIKKAGETELANLLMSVSRIHLKVDWNDIIRMQTINLKNGLNKIGIPDLIVLQNVMQNDLLLFPLMLISG